MQLQLSRPIFAEEAVPALDSDSIPIALTQHQGDGDGWGGGGQGKDGRGVGGCLGDCGCVERVMGGGGGAGGVFGRGEVRVGCCGRRDGALM